MKQKIILTNIIGLVVCIIAIAISQYGNPSSIFKFGIGVGTGWIIAECIKNIIRA